ncbi:hypothetical protein HG15A2_04780 [Adhaeretor mobilis]|uniref:Uncharacterized protein n=1 Tax=Adhaeretor mobilis TaxID=1930276 RepID=A0A517MQQ3_9BACT|nr:hypothetical protein HG15A2_04780 [Adhaeretor mobilis]
MLAKSRRKQHLRSARQQTMLPLAQTCLRTLLREIRDQYFPEITQLPQVYFVQQDTLAGILISTRRKDSCGAVWPPTRRDLA